MESYVEKRYREEAWKFWADDEWMSGGWGIGFAIVDYELNHPERKKEFEEEYKKSKKSA